MAKGLWDEPTTVILSNKYNITLTTQWHIVNSEHQIIFQLLSEQIFLLQQMVLKTETWLETS